MKTAVLYLRVSTTSQVKTDYDPEGISIPAQRLACQRKADQMGVHVIDEYVEPGRSATTIDKRPQFQMMMARLRDQRDADYVIVYNLSRLNRNRVDDANVLMLMRSMKVTLVSAQENIDETPAGQLMHGILAAMNEYRSNADGADIRYKMGQKVKNGGTVARAKVGYLNAREWIDGREIRTIAIDPDRAPLIRLAFELCATGNYGMRRLASTLTDRGLRMRGIKGAKDGGTISPKWLAKVLRDRYYLGEVSYQGEQYPGRHEAVIPTDLFARVQEVMDLQASKSGERQRLHNHYLRSTLWCGRCHARGVESRMLLQQTTKKDGSEYHYFFCSGRQDKTCDAPYLAVDHIEEEVARHYATLRMPDDLGGQLRKLIATTMANEQQTQYLIHGHLTKRLKELDQKEENLLDLIEDGTNVPRVRSRLAAIAEDRALVQQELADVLPSIQTGTDLIVAALDLLDDVPELYRQTTDTVRRQLNQAIYGKLYVEKDGITDELFAVPFDGLMSRRRLGRPPTTRPRSARPQQKRGTPGSAALKTSVALLDDLACGRSSSKATLVELRGFEPLTPSMRNRGIAVYAGRLRHSVAILGRYGSVRVDVVAGRTAGTPITQSGVLRPDRMRFFSLQSYLVVARTASPTRPRERAQSVGSRARCGTSVRRHTHRPSVGGARCSPVSVPIPSRSGLSGLRRRRFVARTAGKSLWRLPTSAGLHVSTAGAVVTPLR